MTASLEEATAHIQSGDLLQAQEVLAQLLRADIRNEQAWFLLAQCVTDPDRRLQCLQRVVAIDPDHALANRLIAELKPPLPTMTIPAESFQPRAFELAESVNEQPATAPESFRPRDFELAEQVQTNNLPAPAFTPRPFVLTESDEPATPKAKEPATSLPLWVRQPKVRA